MSSHRQWYQGQGCQAMRLEEFAVVGRAPALKTIQITEPAVRQQILHILDGLPTEGDEMIKMGPTPGLILTITCAGQEFRLTYFGGNLQTPDTSFYSRPPAAVGELYRLLRDQLTSASTDKPRWYRKGECTSMLIEEFAILENPPPLKQKAVTDPAVIHRVLKILDGLPTHGDKMKKMAAGPGLVLSFTSGGEDTRLRFFGSQLQTPETSFYSGNPTGQQELLHLLKAQLNPR